MKKSTKNYTEKNDDLTVLTENVQSLELENNSLKERLEAQKQSFSDLNENYKKLQKSVENYTNQISALETKLTESEENYTKLQKTTQDFPSQKAWEDLKTENETLKSQLEESEKNDCKKELEETLQKLQKTEENYKKLKENFNDFSAQKEKNEEKCIKLHDFPQEILDVLAEKLSAIYGHEITPTQILEDYLLRYNIQRWSEWFHPFVLKENELLEIAHRANPNITTITDLHRALNIRQHGNKH